MAILRHLPDTSDPKLMEIREKFLDGLDFRLAKIETVFRTLEVNDNPARVIHIIKMQSHRIAGIAGSLGFSELGSCAAKCEDAINYFTSRPTAQTAERMTNSIEKLLTVIDEIMEEQYTQGS